MRRATRAAWVFGWLGHGPGHGGTRPAGVGDGAQGPGLATGRAAGIAQGRGPGRGREVADRPRAPRPPAPPPGGRRQEDRPGRADRAGPDDAPREGRAGQPRGLEDHAPGAGHPADGGHQGPPDAVGQRDRRHPRGQRGRGHQPGRRRRDRRQALLRGARHRRREGGRRVHGLHRGRDNRPHRRRDGGPQHAQGGPADGRLLGPVPGPVQAVGDRPRLRHRDGQCHRHLRRDVGAEAPADAPVGQE